MAAESAMERFVSLFHRYGYIYKPLTGGGWLSAKEDWHLGDAEILKAIACAHPKFFIGCRPGRATRFAVLDIDTKSKHHNTAGLKKITALLERAGIAEHNLYRSSDSGGWHLYIPFDSQVSCRDLYEQLYRLFAVHDIDVARGTLEIFPNPGVQSAGYGLRLPLQPGFAWLNEDTQEVTQDRLELTPAEALDMWMRDFECCANPYKSFHQLKAFVEKAAQAKQTIVARTKDAQGLGQVVPIQRGRTKVRTSSAESVAFVDGVFGTLPPRIHADTWVHGRNYYHQGLTGPSQRADAIHCLSHYLFYGDPSIELPALGYGQRQERAWVMQEILEAKHNQQSNDITNNAADAFAQITRAANWVPPEKRGSEVKAPGGAYTGEVPVAWVKANANRKRDARKKILDALYELQNTGEQFSVRQLWKKSGVAMDTLYKHEDLWRSEYEQLASGFFAPSDPGEYNAVEGAAVRQSQPLSDITEEFEPAGLVEARQVVQDLYARRKDELAARKRSKSKQAEHQAISWRACVDSALSDSQCTDLTFEKLKALIALLAFYLLSAPTEDDALDLSAALLKLRRRLHQAGQIHRMAVNLEGVRFEDKPPPAD